MTILVNEIEAIDIDMDSVPECIYKGCEHEAVWVQKTGCNESGLVCDSHRRAWINLAERFQLLSCKHCDQQMNHWSDHFSWISL